MKSKSANASTSSATMTTNWCRGRRAERAAWRRGRACTTSRTTPSVSRYSSARPSRPRSMGVSVRRESRTWATKSILRVMMATTCVTAALILQRVRGNGRTHALTLAHARARTHMDARMRKHAPGGRNLACECRQTPMRMEAVSSCSSLYHNSLLQHMLLTCCSLPQDNV